MPQSRKTHSKARPAKHHPTPKPPLVTDAEAESNILPGVTLLTSPKTSAPRVVKVHYAKTHLSKLLQRVLKGERVQIAHGNLAPTVELVAIAPPSPPNRAPRQFGALRGAVSLDARFFEPLPADELEAWER